MKTKYLVPFVCLFSAMVLLILVAFKSANDSSAFLEKRAQIVVRNIGHKLLLYGGDSTSSVLPVKQLEKGTFQLEFQNTLSYNPDTLVKLIKAELASGGLPFNYIVNVFECISNEVVYGFEINAGQHDIIPCSGRIQSKGCYSIQIAFTDRNITNAFGNQYYLYLIVVLGFGALAFIGQKYLKENEKIVAYPPINDTILIGGYVFSVKNQLLKNKTETIELSDKESKLLLILSRYRNQVVTRDQLLKEVWEDDGVFTGRSLDMFISKLRKKFRNDTSIRLINIHGKGYKLSIEKNKG